ncbi:MAG TPA: U32 family peptidase [Syntrophomonadaceae bacterium]|nr:U32 family peptidase [Syntrophomonadaceae bacterium]
MMTTLYKKPIIAAPVNDPGEVASLVEAGAGEVYCGFLPERWRQHYSSYDSLSRRQGIIANASNEETLVEIAREAQRTGVPASLALNVRYSEGMLPEVLDYAAIWKQAGGQSVLVSDLGLLLALQKEHLGLQRYLSILAPVFNSRALNFYKHFGISRIVLPRSLSLEEMRVLTQSSPNIDFEAMVLNDRCEYIDGFCSFYHGIAFPPGVSTFFNYHQEMAEQKPLVYTQDLSYAGHGCQLQFRSVRGTIRPEPHDDCHQPHCAACYIKRLAASGIGYLKIGGRGLPSDIKVKAVRFIARACQIAEQHSQASFSRQPVKELYREVYGRDCGENRCYYPGEQIREV